MWLVVGGKVVAPIIKFLKSEVGGEFQGIDQILHLTNTILTRGVGHFSKVEGVVVLTAGCESIVDLGWMLQLDRLGVPVLYFSNYEDAHPSDELLGLAHVKVVTVEGTLKLKDIARGVIDAQENITKESVTKETKETKTVEGVL